MFGPLSFKEKPSNTNQINVETKCLLCEDSFNLDLSLALLLRHLFEVHHMIIEDIDSLKLLPRYLSYWREKFKNVDVDSIVPVVAVNPSDEKYLVLSSLIKEDKLLRHQLNLDYAIQVQEFERTDLGYKKGCLFCKTDFEGKRSDFLEHLSTRHNLQLGNPQNLVFIDELVEKIESKLIDLKCIYCNNTFPERGILKEHMRKKLHKRINPSNKEYDKYYIVNYLEPDKNWKVIQKEEDSYAISVGNDINSDEEYSDWREQEVQINCLLCDHKETDINTLCFHMETQHGFSFSSITKDYDFYQKVKLVNFIRKNIHDLKCPFCENECESKDQLQRHLKDNEDHLDIKLSKFDLPEFYFPTYENDAFLYFIDDVED